MNDREFAEQIVTRVSIAAQIPERMFFPSEDCGVEWDRYLERMRIEQLSILRRQQRQLMTAVLRMRRKKSISGSVFMRSHS